MCGALVVVAAERTFVPIPSNIALYYQNPVLLAQCHNRANLWKKKWVHERMWSCMSVMLFSALTKGKTKPKLNQTWKLLQTGGREREMNVSEAFQNYPGTQGPGAPGVHN